LTGRPSVPETPMIESRDRGVPDRPVKPDGDTFFSRSELVEKRTDAIASGPG
jgi:hypothetical protein